MRVGVVLRVHEHLLEHAAQQVLGELAPVDAELVDRFGVAHADAVEPLHDEHPPRREVVEHRGDPNVPCDQVHFWSLHSGGGNWLMGDASVRFMSYDVNNILPQLCTRRGGEVVSLP